MLAQTACVLPGEDALVHGILLLLLTSKKKSSGSSGTRAWVVLCMAKTALECPCCANR